MATPFKKDGMDMGPGDGGATGSGGGAGETMAMGEEEQFDKSSKTGAGFLCKSCKTHHPKGSCEDVRKSACSDCGKMPCGCGNKMKKTLKQDTRPWIDKEPKSAKGVPDGPGKPVKAGDGSGDIEKVKKSAIEEQVELERAEREAFRNSLPKAFAVDAEDIRKSILEDYKAKTGRDHPSLKGRSEMQARTEESMKKSEALTKAMPVSGPPMTQPAPPTPTAPMAPKPPVAPKPVLTPKPAPTAAPTLGKAGPGLNPDARKQMQSQAAGDAFKAAKPQAPAAPPPLTPKGPEAFDMADTLSANRMAPPGANDLRTPSPMRAPPAAMRPSAGAAPRPGIFGRMPGAGAAPQPMAAPKRPGIFAKLFNKSEDPKSGK